MQTRDVRLNGTPSFRYTRHKEEWHWAIFLPLLMRHGPPPPGVKWYGEMQRVHLTTSEAKVWSRMVAEDCKLAVEQSGVMSHYAPKWRENHGLHIKNAFLEWCRDECENEHNRLRNVAAIEPPATESTSH